MKAHVKSFHLSPEHGGSAQLCSMVGAPAPGGLWQPLGGVPHFKTWMARAVGVRLDKGRVWDVQPMITLDVGWGL